MDMPAFLIKCTGVILLGYTIFNFVKHMKKESKEAKEAANQSYTERFLNGIILYVWYFFITAFSLGMIFNN